MAAYNLDNQMPLCIPICSRCRNYPILFHGLKQIRNFLRFLFIAKYFWHCFFQSFQAAKSPEPAMVAILTRYSILLDCK